MVTFNQVFSIDHYHKDVRTKLSGTALTDTRGSEGKVHISTRWGVRIQKISLPLTVHKRERETRQCLYFTAQKGNTQS